jgi:predicted peroxiredoxin
MAHYLFIESRDPFDSRDVQFVADNAAELKSAGNDVTVYLVQNGVLGARKGAQGSHVAKLAAAGVRLLADDFSLRERGIKRDECAAGIKESNIDALVDMLVADNTKAIWH